MTRRHLTILLFLASGQIAAGDELRETVRRSLAGLRAESERADQYLYRTRNDRRELDAGGKVASQSSYVWERIEIDGFTFGRTLERDGKPLSDRERADEEKAIQKRLAELRAPVKTAGAAGGSGVSARRGPAGGGQDWFQEFPDALDYRLLGQELLDGRPTLHLAASPRPGYQAKNMRARVFEKMKGELWIDLATSELAKVDAEMFDTVSVGFGVLGKIEKGTRFAMRRRVMTTDQQWFTEERTIRFSARVLLLKSIRTESTSLLSDYRLRPSMAAKPITASATASGGTARER